MEKIEEKLGALARLQAIDSKLDEIHRLRGSLPEEVSDLEDDIEGLETRKEKIESEIDALRKEIAKRNNNIKEYSEQIKKYETQQNNVKNSREFEALSKEIEYAQLEILTSEKKNKQFADQIALKEVTLQETIQSVEERKSDLVEKKKELENIVAETEKEEKQLEKLSKEASKKVEERIFNSYKRIRSNMRNGLAVVSTDRDACGGCFAIIPPQVHFELRQKKKLIVCENCGRILVDRSFFEEATAVINH